MTRHLIPLAGALALAACAHPAPISNTPEATVAKVVSETPLGQTVQQGLIDASWNLHQAMAIGVLQANDPAAPCIDDTLRKIGIDPATGQPVTPSGGTPTSFTPKISDLISGGSVAYILAQQAQTALHGGISITVSCEALVGKLIVDGAAAGFRTGMAAGAIALRMPKIP